jgi:hypothetical protein
MPARVQGLAHVELYGNSGALTLVSRDQMFQGLRGRARLVPRDARGDGAPIVVQHDRLVGDEQHGAHTDRHRHAGKEVRVEAAGQANDTTADDRRGEADDIGGIPSAVLGRPEWVPSEWLPVGR